MQATPSHEGESLLLTSFYVYLLFQRKKRFKYAIKYYVFANFFFRQRKGILIVVCAVFFIKQIWINCDLYKLAVPEPICLNISPSTHTWAPTQAIIHFPCDRATKWNKWLRQSIPSDEIHRPFSSHQTWNLHSTEQTVRKNIIDKLFLLNVKTGIVQSNFN